jgi:hypothetical protein
MKITRILEHARSLFVGALVGAAALLASPHALAQDDPPGRVGRVADLNGGVSWFDAEQGQWAPAERNRPLTSGDRLSTAVDGRAELRVGSTVLRLSNSTELEVLRLDDEKLVFQLHSGGLALRVRSREVAAEVELITDEVRLLPQRAGHYRVDRIDDTTLAGSWRGELRVDDRAGGVIATGQRVELYREGQTRELREAASAWPRDGFNEWVTSEDRRDERSASARYVSPEMTGAEDLDRYGRWDNHPEFGAIWLPGGVSASWAPYRDGRWAWVAPWGWTWVDDAPWGFAPFHYGRWVSWRGGWGWVPGAYMARPVFAPALVAWIGGGQWGLSLQIGGPNVGWLPLAPREAYAPHYRATPRYMERINTPPPYRWQHPPGHVPTGPVMYGNQGVPNAVTVVPRDALVQRQPVARVVVDVRIGVGGGSHQPVAAVAPPPAPVMVAPGQGRHAAPGRPWSAREGRPEESRQAVPGTPMVQPVVPPGQRFGPQTPQRAPMPAPLAAPQPALQASPQAPQPAMQPATPRPDREGRPASRRGDEREVIDLRRQAPTPAAAPAAQPAPPPQPARAPQPAPTPAPAAQAAPAAAPAQVQPQRPSGPPRAPAAVPNPAPSPAPAPTPAPAAAVPARPAPPAAAPAPAPTAAPAPAPKPPQGERQREREDERKRAPEVRDRGRDNLN